MRFVMYFFFQAEDGIRDDLVTGVQTCALPIWVRKMPKKDAEELAMHYLKRVKIPEQANKYPGQLSGGQQQRVAIARALCMRSEERRVGKEGRAGGAAE